MNTIIDQIQFEMSNDESARDVQSDNLTQLIVESSEEQRKAIDKALICICGWGFKSLTDKAHY